MSLLLRPCTEAFIYELDESNEVRGGEGGGGGAGRGGSGVSLNLLA